MDEEAHKTEEEADSSALLVAAFNGRIDKAVILLSKPGTNPNVSYSNGNTPLIMAIQENHTNIVKLLLDRPDIKVNQRGVDGCSALVKACYERPDIVKLLLKRPDTDVNLATYYGTTALTCAIRNGNLEAVKALIQHPKINVDFQSKHGENALFEAVAYKRRDIVEILIYQGGCNIDIVDLHDRTPFIIACQYGFQDIALLLIHNGCDTTVQDDCGRNGLYHAVKRNRQMIIHALLDRRTPYTLRNKARVSVEKHRYDFYLDSGQAEQVAATSTPWIRHITREASQGVISTVVNFGNTCPETNKVFNQVCQLIIKEIYQTCNQHWNISLACLEIYGNKVCDLLDMHQAVKTGGQNGHRHSMYGSMYGLSTGKSTFTEIQADTLQTAADTLAMVLKLRKYGSKSHFLCKLRLKHAKLEVSEGWFNIVDMAEINLDTGSPVRISSDPDKYVNIPYQASKLTSLLRECFLLGPGRHTSMTVISNLDSALSSLAHNQDLCDYVNSLKTSAKARKTSTIKDENNLSPVDWDGYLTKQWFQLNSNIPEKSIPEIPCKILLDLTQIQFIKFVKSIASNTSHQEILILQEKLWEEVKTLQLEDKERIDSEKRRAFADNKERKWSIEDEIEQILPALGTTKTKFEAGLNTGFEANMRRFEKMRTAMMQEEWSNKVKASDRAEAKLFPVLSIDTTQINKFKNRRSSIYE